MAQGDIYHPHHWILNVLFGMHLLEVIRQANLTEIVRVGAGNLYERCHLGFLRRWAANECLEQIKADDLFTNCISIGPVNCNYLIF